MWERDFLPDDSAAEAFGAPPRRRRRPSFAVIVVAVTLGAALITLGQFSVRGWLHVGRLLHSCVGAGISTREGREGHCERIDGLFSQPTVYNVVDRHRVLRMPEYEARLLSSTIASTHVKVSARDRSLYPDGRGWLVSYELLITNTRATPLLFGQFPGETARPLYPQHSQVELLIPESLESSRSGSDDDSGFGELVNGNGAPRPSIGVRRMIGPHESVTAWATFVAPEWSRDLLSSRPADLDLLRGDGESHYVGQIRLWK
jgi:hypothetical protein